jgi:hypothetical protein
LPIVSGRISHGLLQYFLEEQDASAEDAVMLERALDEGGGHVGAARGPTHREGF